LTAGAWVPIADGNLAPWDATSLLALVYPDLNADKLPFAALLTDFDSEEFEREHAPRDDNPGSNGKPDSNVA
jgi:hypothetical protein